MKGSGWETGVSKAMRSAWLLFFYALENLVISALLATFNILT